MATGRFIISICDTYPGLLSDLLSHFICTGKNTLLFSSCINKIDSKRVTELRRVTWLLLLLLSRFSRVRPCATPRWQPTRLPHPWDSPGKNTGVGCHFLLQCMKVKSEREVAQSYPTLSNSMDCSPPGSSVHGIFQARVLEWDVIAFSTTICK